MHILRTKELNKIGYTNDKARSLVINITSRHYKHHSLADLIELLINIKNNPESYIHHEHLGKIAETFIEKDTTPDFKAFSLLKEMAPLKIYGNKDIDAGAKKQMELAMSLPVAIQGALMPDTHRLRITYRRGTGYCKRSYPLCCRCRYRLQNVPFHLR